MLKNIFILLALSIGLISCEKVIDIDLNSTDPQIVIVGKLTNDTTHQEILITKTVNFDQSNDFPPVTNAKVSVGDDQGKIIDFTYQGNGIYAAENFKGIPGTTYTMTVDVDGKTYTSTSKMPLPVDFFDLKFRKSAFFGGDGPNDTTTYYYVVPRYFDPSEYINSYRFEIDIDGQKENSILIKNDNIDNGKPNEQPIFTQYVDMVLGSHVTVTMIGIDESVYQYLFALRQISGDGPGGGTTPSNPPNNISNGSLGYFSAQCYQSITKVVQ